MKWNEVKEVILEDGSIARVLDYWEHETGCDLKVVTINEESFWIDSGSVSVDVEEKELICLEDTLFDLKRQVSMLADFVQQMVKELKDQGISVSSTLK